MDSEKWFWAVLWSALPLSLTLWFLFFASLAGGLKNLIGI
jgi:hypothetical protein